MKDEIQKRKFILSKARKKYISSQTRNITEALKLYLKNDANEDEQISLIITKKTKPKNWIDRLGRPKCPDCGFDLGLRIINKPQGHGNLYGWKTCWECIKCGYEEYSKKTIDNWAKEVKKI